MSLTKVKVIDNIYLPHNDVVLWEVETETGERHTLYWERPNFGASFNIHADISADLVLEFNEKMIGKEVHVDIGGAGPAPEVKETTND